MSITVYPIDLDQLDRAWAARTGAANIRRRWARFGPVIDDPDHLRSIVRDIPDDALISMFVDCASFAGDDDLDAYADILADEHNRRWPYPEDIPALRKAGILP